MMRLKLGDSISTRLLAIATVPSLMLACAVMVGLYLIEGAAAKTSVLERGQLVATLLASTAQYGLTSGNYTEIQRSLKQLKSSDQAIADLYVLDAQRRPVATLRDAEGREGFPVEVPVRTDVVIFDLNENAPSVTRGKLPETAFGKGRLLGYVRVTMSPEPVLASRRLTLSFGLGLLAIAAAFSTVAGVTLATRLRASLSKLVAAIRSIREGNYGLEPSTNLQGELREIDASLVEMAQSLLVAHDDMQGAVDARTAQLRAAMQAAEKAALERRLLVGRSIKQLEDERRRIARDIHDHLNAGIVSLRLKAQHVSDLAAGSSEPALEAASADLIAAIGRVYSSGRDLIQQLRPEILDVLGLPGALKELAREFVDPSGRLTLTLHVAEPLPALTADLSIVVYRLVQEALSNVLKHARATHVLVNVAHLVQADVLVVRVIDNGIGFTFGRASRTSVGIVGMRERASAVGGLTRIASVPGRGTAVIFRLPLHPRVDQGAD